MPPQFVIRPAFAGWREGVPDGFDRRATMRFWRERTAAADRSAGRAFRRRRNLRGLCSRSQRSFPDFQILSPRPSRNFDVNLQTKFKYCTALTFDLCDLPGTTYRPETIAPLDKNASSIFKFVSLAYKPPTKKRASSPPALSSGEDR